MKLKSVQITKFKRFESLRIEYIPKSTRLVVLLGPNGCGKSSLFDLLHTYLKVNRFYGFQNRDQFYFQRHLDGDIKQLRQDLQKRVKVNFHSEPQSEQDFKKSIYLRTAYRNEASFQQKNIASRPDVFEEDGRKKTIDDDKTVSGNFQRLFRRLVGKVTTPGLRTDDIMQETIGDIRKGLENIFEDLTLDNLVDPDEHGTFTFSKGNINNFLYDNLSGGEKAVFDLLLDIVVKKKFYDDSIYCIDEPETHLSTRLQAHVLRELFSLIPENSQLWIATHAIGMVREAAKLWTEDPKKVVFLDFGFRADGTPRNFDQCEIIRPANPDRTFWTRHYDVALDDLSEIIAPKQVVLCEGSVQGESGAFDENCYNLIFSVEFPHTLFISVGSKNDVEKRVAGLMPLLKQIVSGTDIVRLRDRDEMTDQEVERKKNEGIRVLSQRNLESVLLCDEILEKLCNEYENPEKAEALKKVRNEKIAASARDDFKPAVQAVHHAAKQELLSETMPGETIVAFMLDILAPLVSSETETYVQLKRDVFGDPDA